MMWLLGWVGLVWGAQFEMGPKELCALSDRVVVAEVTGVEPRWAADGTIERWVHATVFRTVKGTVDDDVSFVLPGGTIDEMTLWYSESATVVSNARYLLFLGDEAGQLRVQGGQHGAVRITGAGARVGVTEAVALAAVEGCHAN